MTKIQRNEGSINHKCLQILCKGMHTYNSRAFRKNYP